MATQKIDVNTQRFVVKVRPKTKMIQDKAMAHKIELPKLGDTMVEALVTKITANLGEKIQKGQIVCEIETDKTTFQIESPYSGTVKLIAVQTGKTIKPGDCMLVIGKENEKINEGEYTISPPKADSKIVCEKFVDDFQWLTEQKPLSQDNITLGSKVALSALKKINAEKAVYSKNNIPCFYLNITADITGTLEKIAEMNKTSNPKITIDDALAKALAVGFEKYPVMTGSLASDSIALTKSAGVSLATSTATGKVGVVIKNVQNKTVEQIAVCRAGLVKKARAGKLEKDDLLGGCITIMNMGRFGINSVAGIVEPGQCSIIGIGEIVETLVPSRRENTVRKLMKMTIAVDHRIANGAEAAQFFAFTVKCLESF